MTDKLKDLLFETTAHAHDKFAESLCGDIDLEVLRNYRLLFATLFKLVCDAGLEYEYYRWKKEHGYPGYEDIPDDEN